MLSQQKLISGRIFPRVSLIETRKKYAKPWIGQGTKPKQQRGDPIMQSFVHPEMLLKR